MSNYALYLLRFVLLPTNTSSIMDVDAFGLLVGLVSSLTSLSEQSWEPVFERDEVKGVPVFNPILVRWFSRRLSSLSRPSFLI